MCDNQQTRGIKRKKKRSFAQQQKRFAKQGRYGKGVQLDNDNYQYFLRIMGVMNTVKHNEDELRTLASNVFKESEGNEVDYSSNQLSSRLYEELLPYTDDDTFQKFVIALTENLRPIFGDPFSSHVLQQSLVQACKRFIKVSNEENCKLRNDFLNYIQKIARFSLNNIEDFAFDTYGNRILRTVLNVLSGNPVKGESLKEINPVSFAVPEEFKIMLNDFAKKVLTWSQLSDLFSQELTSALLQSLLIATKNVEDLNKNLVKKIVELYKAGSFSLEENQAFLRLLETVIIVAPVEYFKKLYKLFFNEHLKELSVSPVCNFVVQKVFTHIPDKELFEKCFDEVKDKVGAIFKAGYTGVLYALTQACHKQKTKQGELITIMMKVLECDDSDKSLMFAPLMCHMSTYDEYSTGSTKISLHGSLIIQEMLYFNKPIKIINSILNMPTSELVQLLSDLRGCHITEAFIKSPFVGEKSRDRLFKKLQGNFLTLATNKHGSRSLDDIWIALHIKQKTIIMEELVKKLTELNSNQYGKCFAHKTHLNSFKHNKETWIKQMNSSSTAEKLFADILPKGKKQKK